MQLIWTYFVILGAGTHIILNLQIVKYLLFYCLFANFILCPHFRPTPTLLNIPARSKGKGKILNISAEKGS